MSPNAEPGVALWSTPAWRAEAVAWLDERLAAVGRARTGPVEQPRVRAWATVLRAPTAGGPVWMKAAGPGTAFEPALYEILVRAVPDRVLTPIAVDRRRAWILLPDGGPSLGELASGADVVEPLVAALARYGRLQRALEPHVGDLLDAGVPDMRPAAMPGRFREALEATRAGGGEVHRRVAALEPAFRGWCERLAASPVPPSLDHNDLHPWNIVGDRYYDWGDSVVAHPFAAVLVPLRFVQRGLGAGLDDPRFLLARDAYLDAFAGLAGRAELGETLALACRVAKIARVLTWERALRAAREQGAAEADWAGAPLATLATVLDPSYLG